MSAGGFDVILDGWPRAWRAHGMNPKRPPGRRSGPGLTSLLLVLISAITQSLNAAEPIPEKLVVLTFDDSVASHYRVVRPILKEHGFGATFFITEGFSFRTNKQDYMTWPEIAELHRDGFEIGNHTRDHISIGPGSLDRLREQVEAIQTRCAEHGIPRPISFAWPGNALDPRALPILAESGIRFARRGGAPEHPYDWGRGHAYEPEDDHPLLIPSAGDARPDWTLADFKAAVDQARDGRIAVIQFHGVPDREHPWVHTNPERFREFMRYLKQGGFTVRALRDLAPFIEGRFKRAENPMDVIDRRKAARPEKLVDLRIIDADTKAMLPARVYLRDSEGRWFFPKSTSHAGSALRYERRNAGNTNAVEMFTTVSAHPLRAELPPGRYVVTVERGKEYFPEHREFSIGGEPVSLTLELRRWIQMSRRGWFSGDTHVHRDPADLSNVLLAEDVNIALPMVDWTTVSTVPPNRSERSFAPQPGREPVVVDATHAWLPRNTEYEIFNVGPRSHTLGAFLLLNHKDRIDLPAPPLAPVAARVREEGGLIELEKHNWPWSMAIVPILKPDLFELANNHHWRTEYAIRNWAVPAPEWMGIAGTGTDTESGWTQYGFQTYYALLNCGFRMQPTAGTAHGVHPVPLGFSRVYVRLEGRFAVSKWLSGLAAGRSFVTTGPMLFATVNGTDPGHRFENLERGGTLLVSGELISENEVERVEIIHNGLVHRPVEVRSQRTGKGAVETSFRMPVMIQESGWLAVRGFETQPAGRLRFAHSAPWWFEVPGHPLRPKKQEVAWLIESVEREIVRSRSVISLEALAEYELAKRHYESLALRAR